MFPSRWLRNVLGTVHSRKIRRRLATPSRKPILLMLESLEERLTPSGGQTAGSYNALTAAIASDTAANTNYVIEITNSFTFNSGGQVNISKLGSGSTLTLEGQSGTNFTLTGNGNRLFTVSSGQNVTFKDLTLTGGGKVNLGGGILDKGGNVTLSKASVQDNTVSAFGADGGGVFVSANSALTIQGGSTLQSNHAIGTGSVTTSKGAQQANSGSGGGLYALAGSTIIIQDSTIRNNTVSGNEAVGGGVCVFTNRALSIQGGSTIQSNRANGVGSYDAIKGTKFPNFASGGGVYAYGASTVQISDSVVANNVAQGGQGADGTSAGASGVGGGLAQGGGLYVIDAKTVTLIGATLSGNAAIGGNGGNGTAGGNATGTNASGGAGGAGGYGGSAEGGAAWFGVGGSQSVTILNDADHPSIMIDNTVKGGSGGNGGGGGNSTGTANNSDGGDGGMPLVAEGGALDFGSGTGATVSINIGNTTFYGNTVEGGNGGAGGAAGTGGSGTDGKAGANQDGSGASGGGLNIGIGGGSVTMVNCTVAKNTAATGIPSGVGSGNAVPGSDGGGINDGDPAGVTEIFDNNTITQNTVSGVANLNGEANDGSGFLVFGSNLSLFNNLIEGNESIGSSTPDFEVFPAFTTPVSNAAHNFLGSMSTNAVDTATNIIGNSQTQLGTVVGVDSSGKPTGGPIYYPLLPGTVSVGAGTTSVLSAIAGVEGTTPANAVDEIGNPRSNNGSIDLGAVQIVTPPAITGNPSSQTVTAGQTATFTASASGSPTPTVQWRVSTNGGKTFSTIGGATSTTLTLNNVSVSMSGYEYQAVVTNSAGTIATSAATLTVNPVPPPPPPSPPAPPPAPPALNVPPLLALVNHLLGAVETVNGNGTETITDIFFGIHLFVSTFDSSGNLVTVTLFGFNVTFLFA